MSEMASRISQTRALLPALEASLKAFQQSSTPFKIIRSINLASSNSNTNTPPLQPPTPIPSAKPKTLFILDSSYNPPSRAHLALATTALRTSTDPAPRRLLLLFSTSNADKAAQPASFVHRIAMMILFAEDLLLTLQQQQQQSHNAVGEREAVEEVETGTGTETEIDVNVDVEIDIGLTKEPYYTSKSHAITTALPPPYPSNPTHTHLLGYDTLTRFLSPKYYATHTPPLSALSPFFDAGHKLLVLLRPSSSAPGTSSPQEEKEIQDQTLYITTLPTPPLKHQGFNPSWSAQIATLQGPDVKEAAGISSTLIRAAVGDGEWGRVEGMCTPGVAAWIRGEGLYAE
ncbi:hypothetical protein EG328_006765 [Venturia inaequalis]|uniref:Nucleotidylyl transferase n=1 Tax=Venturia inaequalis TaxID=5025 RepID=A0A8H3VC19_VENIN|nr:hypothetical protein EG328_006765 [Venturia inaequalis]